MLGAWVRRNRTLINTLCSIVPFIILVLFILRIEKFYATHNLYFLVLIISQIDKFYVSDNCLITELDQCAPY
jgi:hypothetical protein